MQFVSGQDAERISRAITAVEGRTEGELVTVIAQSSDDYFYIPTLWAAVAAIFFPVLAFFAGGLQPTEFFVAVQLSVFVVLSLLFRIPSLKMFLIPKAVKQGRAARLARQQFFEQGLHMTKDRIGILIFVSVAEHYVEILADQGINEKVDHSYWQGAVEAFVGDVKSGRVVDGFLAAINRCGKVLAEHFPVRDGEKNELPNRLIML